jgi:hypothetical protein
MCLMEFTYKKNDNVSLFESVNGAESIGVLSPQNYNPLYETFFTLSNKNNNSVNLNNKNKLSKVIHKITNTTCLCIVNDIEKTVFFKYCPLIDPSKYIIGKYDITDVKLLQLPSFGSTNSHAKTRDPNNSAYVDGFFAYLSSQLLHTHKFVHAVDFYGSFLGDKTNFEYNIADDIEHLNNSDFFHKNNGTVFKIDSDHATNIFNFDTRQNKDRLSLSTPMDNCDDIVELSDLNELVELSEMFVTCLDITKSDSPLDLLFSHDLSNNKIDSSTSSTCSSRSSDTENESDDKMSNSLSWSDSDGGFSTASEDVMIATIPSFPVNVISLEKCDDTLDSLIIENCKKMTDNEWCSIIIQVIMSLIAYQKTFHMTHNDLHTNNIMYIKTTEPFLYYKVNDTYYKVPTFGRIYKIIDFGRAIYKFRGNTICSDSYHKSGDAASQYNFEPYVNKNKPIIEPNFSFDLCRLGCSLIDFFDDDNIETDSTMDLIEEWCEDDQGRNVLYKKNGDERYPNFKLYKMIARTVHNHTPEKELNKKYFSRFRISKKKIDKSSDIMNIDELPSYIN